MSIDEFRLAVLGRFWIDATAMQQTAAQRVASL
jgi:hypothetical protein